MRLLQGKTRADELLENIQQQLQIKHTQVCLAVILVGQDLASKLYVSLKSRAAERIGMDFRAVELPETSTEEEVASCIEELNADPAVQGIILQLPLPRPLKEATDNLISLIDPVKDADGTHPTNVAGFLAGRQDVVMPVFPRAILELIKMAEQSLTGKRAVIVCHSEWFAQVMQETLRREGVAETEIFSEDDMRQGAEVLKQTDILITVCGVQGLIMSHLLKPGVIVIDGGIVPLPDGRVVGDVDRASFESFEAFLSPVPGGVGPVTVACLLDNVYQLSDR